MAETIPIPVIATSSTPPLPERLRVRGARSTPAAAPARLVVDSRLQVVRFLQRGDHTGLAFEPHGTTLPCGAVRLKAKRRTIAYAASFVVPCSAGSSGSQTYRSFGSVTSQIAKLAEIGFVSSR